MHLLDHVGQMEVGKEGPHQFVGGLDVDVVQHRGGGGRLDAGAGADLLDQIEKLGPLLTAQGLPEHSHDPADVGAKGKVIEGGLGHRRVGSSEPAGGGSARQGWDGLHTRDYGPPEPLENASATGRSGPATLGRVMIRSGDGGPKAGASTRPAPTTRRRLESSPAPRG